MVWLSDGKKKFEDMFIRFDMIHERNRQTDGQNRQRITAQAALMHSMARQKYKSDNLFRGCWHIAKEQ